VLSKNDVANLALARLGVSLTIVDVNTEQTKQAVIIRQHYQSALETLLELHPWKFATRQAPLSLQTTDPVKTFKYAYAYPADAMTIREIACDGIFSRVNLYEDQKEYFEEADTDSGVVIYADIKNAHAKYTKKILDSQGMPVHFGRALAAQLSMDIGPSLITNNFPKVVNMLNGNAQNEISAAIAKDEGRQPQMQDSAPKYYRDRF
jgi:hypothetical protein